MPQTPTLSLQQARDLMLTTLGLAKPPRRKPSKVDVLNTIRQITVLQIDTISVVARAHLHILWSRLGNYNPDWIEELRCEGSLFEYYAHAMCFIPIEDYPIYRRHMLNPPQTRTNIDAVWEAENIELLNQIREHIKMNGAVRSADFERPEKGSAWWDWKKEKVALEHLFYRGEVMVSERRNFQRVYDLRERIHPGWDDQNTPSYEDAIRAQVLKAAKALGVAKPDWLASYYYLLKKHVQKLLPDLVREGNLIPVEVAGFEKQPFYVHHDNAQTLQLALEDRLKATHTSILSMFDPLVTDRSRTRELFGFDYLIECYTPAPKRVYGYFVLPILRKGKLVGRMDAKAWRKEKRLEVIHLFLEPGVKPSRSLAADLAQTLSQYASWQGLSAVEITQTTPSEFCEILKEHL
ncbi:MAG TPA: crosslink repair DNA glycosylase YcaQ family protein [Anaerolineaceae bacterium]|nr:crosslink repair DNA glycosylase YcaQ family protein [Anaerolineaceae bacterium]